jgi:TrmH family RNA methyltransferase
MNIITSPENIQIKNAAALKQKKFRDKNNLFLIEGIRLVETALQSNASIRDCFYLPTILENNRAATLIEQLSQRENCFLHEITTASLQKLTDTDSPQGIIAVVQKNTAALDENLLSNKPAPAMIILDHLQDPGNLGTIIRTADAAGIDAVILTKGTVDVFSPKVVRSTMGSLFHLPIVTGVLPNDLKSFAVKNGITLISTVLSTDAAPCFSINYQQSVAIIFGNEGAGISTQMCSLSDKCIFIPMFGRSESLNASSAAAMIMYEIMRQKHYN